jgi:hypothetical protein
MTKPTPFLFDTNGTNADADLSAGLKSDGYANNAIPTARQFDTALWLISQNLSYLQGTDVRCEIPQIFMATAATWAAVNGGGSLLATPNINTAANGEAICALRANVGRQLTAAGLTFLLKGNAPATDILDVSLIKIPVTDTGYVVLRSRRFKTGGTPLPTIAADETLPEISSNTSMTLAVAGSANTYTRTTGSFVTDGWRVGDCVRATGWVNGANNFPIAVAGKTVTSVTATVLVVNYPGGGAVSEGPIVATLDNGGAIAALDGTFSLGVQFLSSGMVGGSAIGVSALRYALSLVA